MNPNWQTENLSLYHGDCLDIMREMPEGSVDTVITDPPYGLEFMGKEWDHGVPGIPFWREALRVAKPGAMLMAFGGTRTHHRLMCAIEDAGWEIRDCVMWLYGSGFPKSLDISKAIDKAAGAKREVVGSSRGVSVKDNQGFGGIARGGVGIEQKACDVPITAPATDAAKHCEGWGTSLKPAWEPIILAMKPLDGTYAANAQKWGVAGLWIDGGRVAYQGDYRSPARASGEVNSGGTFGTGVVKFDDAKAEAKGRWPANVILDPEAARMLDEQSGVRPTSFRVGESGSGKQGMFVGSKRMATYLDSGGASRFFYVPKASRRERNAGLEGMPEKHAGTYAQDEWSRQNMGNTPDAKRKPMRNTHPTVKPLALMRYLCRLTKTPTGGVILDPFMGSGSTGVAALQEGRQFIGIEKDVESFLIAVERINHAQEEAAK